MVVDGAPVTQDSIGNNFDLQFAPARAVKFAQEHALPPAQNQLPILHKEEF
jgi:hypothetical protein